MIELLIFGAGAATGALALALPYSRAVRDRALLQTAKDSLAIDAEALKNRVIVLRGDNLVLQGSVDRMREGHDRLVDERDNAVRKLGRIEAERRAEMMALPCEKKPGTITVPVNRDPATGRFARKPQPASPIACG